MKKLKFLTYFVTIALFAHGQGVSMDGQNGRDTNAVKLTVDQWLGLVFHGKVPSNLAFFGGYKYNGKVSSKQDFEKAFRAAMPQLQPAMQKIVVDRLNAANSVKNPIYVNTNGQPLLINAIVAEQLLRKYVVDENAEPGKHIYLSFDIKLNGTVISTIPRDAYPNEELFVFEKPGCKKMIEASDICGNFPADSSEEYGKTNNGQPGNGQLEDEYQVPPSRKLVFRQPDGTETAQVIPSGSGNVTIILPAITNTVYGSKFSNIGNSEVTNQTTAPAVSTPAPVVMPAAPAAIPTYNPGTGWGGGNGGGQDYSNNGGQFYGYGSNGQYGLGAYNSYGEFQLGLSVGRGGGYRNLYDCPHHPSYRGGGNRGGTVTGGNNYTGSTVGTNTNTTNTSGAWGGNTLGTNTNNGTPGNTGTSPGTGGGGRGGAYTRSSQRRH